MPNDPQEQEQNLNAEALMPQVYDELRQLAGAHLARGQGPQTMQATALVNEAFLKLAQQSQVDVNSREGFFRLAARVMRNVLVDHVRAKQADKRGGDRQRVTLTAVGDSGSRLNINVLALHEALEELTRLSERKALLVELRFFGGMTELEAASALGISRAEATREWRLTRAWLQHRLRDAGERL